MVKRILNLKSQIALLGMLLLGAGFVALAQSPGDFWTAVIRSHTSLSLYTMGTNQPITLAPNGTGGVMVGSTNLRDASTLWTPLWGSALPAPAALLCQWKNQQALAIVRISAYAVTAGGGGTLGSQFQVTDGTHNCNTGQDMLTTATQFSSDAPTGTCAFAAASTLSLRTIADDHTSEPSVVTFTVEFIAN
jgi:hypothetical protein